MDEVQIIPIQIPSEIYERQITVLIEALLALDEQQSKEKTTVKVSVKDRDPKEAA